MVRDIICNRMVSARTSTLSKGNRYIKVINNRRYITVSNNNILTITYLFRFSRICLRSRSVLVRQSSNDLFPPRICDQVWGPVSSSIRNWDGGSERRNGRLPLRGSIYRKTRWNKKDGDRADNADSASSPSECD